jgi:lactate permease
VLLKRARANFTKFTSILLPDFSMEVTDAFFAALPIGLILVLMLGLRWSAAAAGSAGLAAALALAWVYFGYGTDLLPEFGVAGATAGAMGEAGFIAITILWIIFPALCIYELQVRTGGVGVLQDAMGRLSDDPRIMALLVAWFFALFMEGAAGFGTSVALAAPFLLAAGFKPVQAVVVALIGHSVGVSFGAVGTPILPQMAVTGFSGLEISAATGLYHGLVGWIMPVLIIIMVRRTIPREQRIGWRIWIWTLAAAAFFLVPMVLASLFVGPELPTLASALFGGFMFVLLLLWARRRGLMPIALTDRPPISALAILRAAAPYLVLVTAVLLTRLIPPLRELLTGIVIAWRIEPFGGSVALLYHPGTMLMAGFAVGAFFQGARHAQVVDSAMAALRRLGPVTVSLVAMLALSRIMVYSGMIDTMAMTTAAVTGGAWPVFAPFVGMLGTFVTGSATASNILFTDFQLATAEKLGISPLPLLGAQGFGAAVGNIICPHNIIAAGATVSMTGQESEVLARTIGPALLYAFLGGLLALLVFT